MVEEIGSHNLDAFIFWVRPCVRTEHQVGVSSYFEVRGGMLKEMRRTIIFTQRGGYLGCTAWGGDGSRYDSGVKRVFDSACGNVGNGG